MDRYREKQVIFERLERYRELLRQFPDAPTSETIRDYIADLEQQLRRSTSKAASVGWLPFCCIARPIACHHAPHPTA